MEAEILESLLNEVRQRIADLSDNVATGSCQSYDEYAKETGAIRELRMVLDLHEEIEQKYLDD